MNRLSRNKRRGAWSYERLKQVFELSHDVRIDRISFDDSPSSEIVFVFNTGLTDNSRIVDHIIPELNRTSQQTGLDKLGEKHIYGSLPLEPIDAGAEEEQLSDWIYSGDVILLIAETGNMFKIGVNKSPQRTPEESSTEVTIKGAKDGFTEDLQMNVALVRKRIRSNCLKYEQFIIGTRTRTRIALLYVDDILNADILKDVRSRLNKILVDGIFSSDQLKDLIEDRKYSMFPMMDYTGRPDKAVYGLLAGRFILIVDGNPMVLIGPANFFLQLKSPEDINFNFIYVAFTRLIRGASFGISMLLPGLWVTLTSFHPDQIPFRLMATVATTRLGIPFSAAVEMFILLFLLEIFREAGIRLPTTIGSTLTVVGGLIIGDASIRAGLVSPSVVVVGAITAVCSVTLVNQSLSAAVSFIRFLILLCSSMLGIMGFIISLLLLIIYMSSLRSFGIPYLAPVSPIIFKDFIPNLVPIPWRNRNRRPEKLQTIDSDRMRKDDEHEGRI